MKNKKILALVAMLILMLSMTGCGNVMEQLMNVGGSETVETTDDDDEKEDDKDSDDDEKKEDDEDSDDDTTVTGGSSGISDLMGDSDDKKVMEFLATIFPDADVETGFVCYDRDDVEDAFRFVDVDVLELSRENLEENEDALLYFAMYNQKSAEQVGSSSDAPYLTQLVYNDEPYFVLFGNGEADEEEVEIFTQEGTTLEYWALGMEEDGMYMLMPFIAGNEENGYYIVRPLFESTGMDVSDVESLVDQGIDFTTDEDSDLPKEDDEDDVTANLTGEEKIYFEITDIEEYDTSVTVYYEMTNTYPVDVTIWDETILLNGEDITESTLGVYQVEANSTVEDYFHIFDDYTLKAGDELIIRGKFVENDNYADADEEIEFVFKLTDEQSGSGSNDDSENKSTDTQRIGSDEVGYVDVPDDFVKFKNDVDLGEGTIQYSDANGKNIVTLQYFDDSRLDAELVAGSMYMQFEEDSNVDQDSLTSATVKLDGREAYQVYCYYPDEDIFVVTWSFTSPDDDYIHYVAVEFTSDNMDLFEMVEDTYSLAE